MQGRGVRRMEKPELARLPCDQDAISIRDKAQSWPSLDLREAHTLNPRPEPMLNPY